MAHAGSSVFTVPRPVPWRSELDPIVIWLSGERDIATDGALRLAVARSMASAPPLAMEPSGVELMSVSTLETIARAREPLWHRSRSLTVRAFSGFVRRIIDSYGLTDLCGPQAGNLANSLSPWVAVPAPGGPIGCLLGCAGASAVPHPLDHDPGSARPQRRPARGGHITKAAVGGQQPLR